MVPSPPEVGRWQGCKTGTAPAKSSGAAVQVSARRDPQQTVGRPVRTAAAKATAPAGKQGEGQDRQHTERAGQDRSGNAANGSPQTVSVFLLLWRGLQKPVALVAAGPPPVPV